MSTDQNAVSSNTRQLTTHDWTFEVLSMNGGIGRGADHQVNHFDWQYLGAFCLFDSANSYLAQLCSRRRRFRVIVPEQHFCVFVPSHFH